MINKFSLLQSALNNNLSQANRSLNILASAKRLNRASDDAAGIAVVAQLKNSANLSLQGNRNMADAKSALQIADSSTARLSEISTRMQELATQAGSGLFSDAQRETLNLEYQQLGSEAERLVATTQFNGQNLLEGQGFSVQTGGEGGSQIHIGGLAASDITEKMTAQDISTQEGAQAALAPLKDAIGDLSKARGSIGSLMTRLDSAVRNNAARAENKIAAASAIEDADIAAEVAKGVASQIRTQVSAGLAAQAGGLNAEIAHRLLS